MAFSLLDVRNKYGGGAPDSMSEYYRGGSFVADTVGNAGIPSSGAISLSQLQAGYNTSSATTILSHVWNNRSVFFFKSSGSNTWVWSGDAFDRNNSPVNRYVGSRTISGGIGPVSPNHSNWTTVVGFAAGSSSSITALSTNQGSGTLYQNDTGAEMSWWVVHINAPATSVTSVTLTASRTGGNSGSWDKILVLPGKWAFDDGQRVSNQAMSWSRALPSGRIGWMATGTGYNANMTPPIGGTNAYIIRGSEWWYNNSAMYLQFNPSGGTYTFDPGNMTDNYGNATGFWAYNRRYNELYLIG